MGFSDVHGRAAPGDGPGAAGRGARLPRHRASRSSFTPAARASRPCTPTSGTSSAARGRGSAAGTNLTPYYVVPEDAVPFHRTLRDCCARHDASFYPRFKRWCDDYFFLPHRNEPRGVGGLFFDYLGAGAEATAGQAAPEPPFAGARPTPRRCSPSCATSGSLFWPPTCRSSNGAGTMPWGERERDWQLLRRGRYVEFNLLYDRGTVFGLRTDGRVESILMSLPPEVRWAYAHAPEPGSPEEASLAASAPRRDWAERRAP